MAVVKGNVWGHLSGKVGNFSAKITKGRTIMGQRPVSFTVPNDTAAINRRKVFKAALSLSKQIISLPLLKKVWNLNKEPYASGYNKVTQVNYNLVTAERPTVSNKITPDGFVLGVTDPLLDADKFTATIAALNTVTPLNTDEVHVSINAVICYHSPLVDTDEPYAVIALNKEVPNFDFESPYSLQLDLNVLQKTVAAKYDSSILYLSIVPKTADERVYRFSATYAQAF